MGLRNLAYPINFTINSTDSLTSLDGLQSLKHVRSSFHLEDNASLLTTEHLTNLKHAGYISIESNQVLHDLTGFKLVERITGIIKVVDNPNLTSLAGLDSLKAVNGLYLTGVWTHLNNLHNLDTIKYQMEIVGNNHLLDISGISSMSFVGDFVLKNNPLLKEIPEFSNLTEVTNIRLENNDKLESLSGFHNITFMRGGWSTDLGITDNDILTSLSGLDMININGVDLVQIKNNPLLTHCHVQSLCNFLLAGKPSTISNNADGCSSVSQVTAKCIVATDDPEVSSLVLFPNPTDSFIHLSTWPSGSQCYITDLSGMPIHSWSQINEVIDLTSQPPGIYFVQIKRNGYIKTMKVVKI